MENPEEILHSLEEFTKLKPKDIPKELEEYLCFVAKTGDPVYQWAIVKSLFKEKLISVITEFYESCPSIELPPCPNVDVFNYETMKSFILEKLDTFIAAPFTVQRICELLTTPRKEYNRIDKYMRALEKNILVVSTTEPLNRRSPGGNAEGIVNGLESIESKHNIEANNSNDINVEEMDDTPDWSRVANDSAFLGRSVSQTTEIEVDVSNDSEFVPVARSEPVCIESVIACRPMENQPFVSIEPIISDNCVRDESMSESDISVTITAIPAAVQKRRDSIEPIVSSADEKQAQIEPEIPETKENNELPSSPSSLLSQPIESDSEINIVSATTEPQPCEVDTSVVQSSTVPLVIIPEITTNIELENSEINMKSNSLIQIPVISDITSGVNIELVSESSIQSPITSLQDDSNSRDSTALSEPSEVLVSTSTPEPIQLVTSHINLKTPTIETIVSSSDDLNSDMADLKSESSSQEESSTESLDNTSEAEEKHTEESMCGIQEFASSSTVTESVAIILEEETCQEAPSTLSR